MTRHAIPALGALACVLGGLLWHALTVPETPGDAPGVTPSGASSGALLEPVPPRAAARGRSDDVAADVAKILARPLFEANRRPPAAAPVAAAAAVVPRVTGLVVTASGRSAIFAVPGDPRPVVVGQGGRVGVFTVRSIEAGAVTLLGPDGPLVLRPSFAAPTTVAAPGAATPGTAPGADNRPRGAAASAGPVAGPPGAGLPPLPPGPLGAFGLPSLPGLPARPADPGAPTSPAPPFQAPPFQAPDPVPLPTQLGNVGQEAPK
jgi:hypothetical protein